MKLKEIERIEYEKSPLVEVVAQVKFNIIQSINDECPEEFSNKIKETYPNQKTEKYKNISIHVGPEIESQSDSSLVNIYHFETPDSKYKTTLTQEHITLTCNSYENWEKFKFFLQKSLSALNDCRGINPISNRIGLRYVDIIIKSNLTIEDEPWSELLAPWVIGMYGAADIFEIEKELTLEEFIQGSSNQSFLKLGNTNIGFTTGLVKNNQGQLGFLIDKDFFQELNNAYDTKSIDQIFDELHSNAGILFNHCITGKLRQALGAKIKPNTNSK